MEKHYPAIQPDLAGLYEQIVNDHRRVPNGHAIPGFGGTVWKYRCESSSMSRGKSGGFRLLAFYNESNNTIYPFCVYGKKKFEKTLGEQPPQKDIRKWIANLLASLKPPAG